MNNQKTELGQFTENQTSENQTSLLFLSLLSGLSALGQFATSVYLPSLPSIGREFMVTMSVVQLTMIGYLLAFAFFQLLWGPLTDRFGRKPILYFGIISFLLGSLVSYASPTIWVLIAGRVLQAIGGSATIVVARAITRDTHSGTALAQALTVITIVFSAAPGLAPLLGGFLDVHFGWRSTFLAAMTLGILLLLCIMLALRETLSERSKSLSLSAVAGLYKPLWQSKRFMVYIGASSFAMGGLYVFFSGGPALFITDLHISPAEYGSYPVFTVLGFVAGGIIARKVLDRFGSKRLTLVGFLIMLTGAALMLAFPYLGFHAALIYNVWMFVFVAGLGIVLPLSMAEALADFPERAGAASAMSGFMQMFGAALGAVLVGRLADIPFLGVPIGMVIMSLAGLIVFLAFARKI